MRCRRRRRESSGARPSGRRWRRERIRGRHSKRLASDEGSELRLRVRDLGEGGRREGDDDEFFIERGRGDENLGFCGL